HPEFEIRRRRDRGEEEQKQLARVEGLPRRRPLGKVDPVQRDHDLLPAAVVRVRYGDDPPERVVAIGGAGSALARRNGRRGLESHGQRGPSRRLEPEADRLVRTGIVRRLDAALLKRLVERGGDPASPDAEACSRRMRGARARSTRRSEVRRDEWKWE